MSGKVETVLCVVAFLALLLDSRAVVASSGQCYFSCLVGALQIGDLGQRDSWASIPLSYTGTGEDVPDERP